MYNLYIGDKTKLQEPIMGDFDTCMRKAIGIIGEVEIKPKPISKMQIKLLAPE